MSRPITIANLSDPREVAFVTALLELGGPQYAAAAAQRAGYGSTMEEAERAASMLMASSRISRAIIGEIRARFDSAAAAAFNTLLTVCNDPRAPASARISAAQEILSRSSLGPTPSRSLAVTAHVGIEDLIARLDHEKDGVGL